jgi:hypothetical protein
MYGNKKMYLMLYLLYKYRIAPTTMQLDSLETVYDIYLYKLCYTVYVFIKCCTLRKKYDTWFTSRRIYLFKRKNLKF